MPTRIIHDTQPLSLAELAGIFLRTGTLAFGGGAATLAMLHDEFCVRRHVLSSEEYQLLFGLSRLVPGINLLGLTVLLGYQTCGLAGSVCALASLTLPSFAIIVLGCKFLGAYQADPRVAGALRGLSVGAAALLLYTSWQLCHGALHKATWLSRALWTVVAAAGAAVTLATPWHPAWVIMGGGVAGVLLGRWMGAPAR
jgi:chromate transporter